MQPECRSRYFVGEVAGQYAHERHEVRLPHNNLWLRRNRKLDCGWYVARHSSKHQHVDQAALCKRGLDSIYQAGFCTETLSNIDQTHFCKEIFNMSISQISVPVTDQDLGGNIDMFHLSS
jgi:hypothetical protein